MSIPIDLILKVTGFQDIERLQTSLGRIDPAAHRLAQSLTGAGKQGKAGLMAIGEGAQKARGDLKQLQGEAGKTRDILGTVGRAMVGGALLATTNTLTNSLISMSKEATGAQKKLEAMLKVRGESGSLKMLQDSAQHISKKTGFDDDAIADAQAHLLSFGMTANQIKEILPGAFGQAITMGKDLNSVVDSIGRGFSSINAGAMTKSGIVFSPEDMKAFKALKESGDTAGAQAKLFEMLRGSFNQYAVKLGEGMDASTVKMGYFNKTLGDTGEIAGKGAADMRAAWMGALTPMLEGLNENHEGLVRVGGAATEIFTQMLNTGLPVVQLVWEYKNAKNLTAIATSASATAHALEAAAITASGNAAAGAAVKMGALARARALAGTPLGKGGLIVGGGLLVGGAGYHALQSSGALGEEAAPLGEAVSNTAGRIGAFLTTGRSSSYDTRVQGEWAEQKSAEITQRLKEKRLAKIGGPGADAIAEAVDSSTANTSTPGGDSDAIDAQIEAVKAAIRGEKNKTRKAELREQLVALQRAKKDAKEAESEAKKAADWANEVAQLSVQVGGSLALARMEAVAKIQANREKVALNSQVEKIEAMKEAGTIDETRADNEIAKLKHAYEVRNAAMEKDVMLRAANVEAQAKLAEAQVEASTQEGAQAKATLEKARINAAAIIEKARIESSVIGTDIAPVHLKQSPIDKIAQRLKALGRFQAGGNAANALSGIRESMAGGSMFGMASGNYGEGLNPHVRVMGQAAQQAATGGFARVRPMGSGFNPNVFKAKSKMKRDEQNRVRVVFDDIVFPNDYSREAGVH